MILDYMVRTGRFIASPQTYLLRYFLAIYIEFVAQIVAQYVGIVPNIFHTYCGIQE